MSRRVCLVIGGVALASSLFWMITGMGLWSPIRMDDFPDVLRAFSLFFAHCLALFAGAFALAEGESREDPGKRALGIGGKA